MSYRLSSYDFAVFLYFNAFALLGRAVRYQQIIFFTIFTT